MGSLQNMNLLHGIELHSCKQCLYRSGWVLILDRATMVVWHADDDCGRNSEFCSVCLCPGYTGYSSWSPQHHCQVGRGS